MATEQQMNVSLARTDDLDAVLALLEDARRWLIERGLGEQWPETAPPSVFADRLAREEVYLARRDGRAIGTFSLLWADPAVWGDQPPEAGYVHGLAVLRAGAGKNVGGQLLDIAAAKVRGAGRRLLRLDCWAGNPALCAYYDRLGFRRRGTKDLGGFVVQRFERRADDQGSGSA